MMNGSTEMVQNEEYKFINEKCSEFLIETPIGALFPQNDQ